jgi:hypothetical protein
MLTEKCSKDCDHCLFECKPTGKIMTEHTFLNTLNVMSDLELLHIIGGEISEMRDINKYIDILIQQSKQIGNVNFVTNGLFIYNALNRLQQYLNIEAVTVGVSKGNYHYDAGKASEVIKQYGLTPYIHNYYYEPLPIGRGRFLYDDLDNFRESSTYINIYPPCIENILKESDIQTYLEDVKGLVVPSGDIYLCENGGVKIGNVNTG